MVTDQESGLSGSSLELTEDLEEDLCKVWDMAMDKVNWNTRYSTPCSMPTSYKCITCVFSLGCGCFFFQEFKAPGILLGVIAKSRSPRLTVSHFTTVTALHNACMSVTSYNYLELVLLEICIGILGNMACFHDTCVSLSQNSDLW